MATKKWVLDSAHSEIQFKVKHLVISTVTGSFSEFSGEATTPDDTFQGGEISVTIGASSANTNNEKRDEHLKSEEFFDAENHKSLTVKTKSIKQINDDEYTILADLTIKGVTKEVAFKGEYGGIAVDGYGNRKVGIEITGKINRTDYGLNWNAVIEGGGLTVSEEVKLIGNLQFTEQ
ncbi:polyisoprenoid-binding protein [Flavobacterium suaedae]|uniref:Polyisoprenoid-binding protein n=1 Tax=Flavobacterium suaedae TaxID=1767027 RepID=A0ABQ1JTR8_9FLAO|nr:YceI family protein [Flavobacterium suaedae]GGB75340.1 polyisoprenoid-binding protein [Flavobacterium suaedae]